MPSFFFREVPTHHSFTFNLWFLYEHEVFLFKTVCGIFYFWFRLIFINAIQDWGVKKAPPLPVFPL